MTPIAAVCAKALQPVVEQALGLNAPPSPSSQATPAFQRELLRGSDRSAEIVMPIDYELLSLCRPERQKEFGQNILGHTVQAVGPKGQIVSGTVQKVWMEDNRLHFQVADQEFSIGDLRAIYQAPVASPRIVTPQPGAKS